MHGQGHIIIGGIGQMETPCDSKGAVVLTTHERSGYFTSVLGDDIDLRFNPHHEGALENVLHNTIAAGGSLAIIDEAYFMDADDMAMGLESFFRKESHPERLKLIIVCTHREAGDLLLAFLVMYCGIYNIIYGKSGVDVSIDLSRLIEHDNSRADVLHLAESGRWHATRPVESQIVASDMPYGDLVGHDVLERSGFKRICRDVLIDVKGVRLLKVHIDISAVVE